jgi:hypothetical protein
VEELRFSADVANKITEAVKQSMRAKAIDDKDRADQALAKASNDPRFTPDGVKELRELFEHGYKNALWFSEWREEISKQAIRRSLKSVNRAVNRASIRNVLFEILKYSYYVFWSLFLFVIMADFLIPKIEYFLSVILDTLFQIEIEKSNSFWTKNAIKLSLLTISWIAIDIYMRPIFEQSQKDYERWSVKCYASDVFNAVFKVRCYGVFVEATRLAARSQLSEVETPKRIPYVPEAPSLESLSNLEPISRLMPFAQN